MAEDETFIRIETASDNRDAAVRLAGMARRQIAIFSHDLEPQVYDDPEFLEAVRNLAIRGGKVSIRILLVDATRSAKEGNRLVELSRRLSSYIQIRRPHRDYLGLAEAFMVVDEYGLLWRKLASRWDGVADTHDPPRAREKMKLFNTIWEKSQQDSETRQLRI